MKLLAVGDIHLGRRPTRLPEELSHTPAELGPAAAWRLTVEFAVNENVDAVLLAGDVVESEKDFFEGFRELKAGVDRLTAAGIEVIAVAGNHDVEVLPRLAKVLEGEAQFKLLGQGGVWESHTLEARKDKVKVWGWSFPRKEVHTSPLAGVAFDRNQGFQLGLLHCDLNQSASPYAPVMQRELNGAGLDAWLLGHIHKPHALSPKSLCGYLGCLSGMDPGESGARGPWMLRIEGGCIRKVAQVPIAPLRWESLQIDISTLDDPGEISSLLITQAQDLDKKLFSTGPTPKAVGLRVRFVGQTRFARELSNQAREFEETQHHFPVGDREYFVEHCEVAVLPRTDLAALAQREDPLGLLAARLLLLDRPSEDPERTALVQAATAHFRESLGDHKWRGLESNAEALTETEVVERLRLAGSAALQTLYAQQQGALN